jgi:hypothetical protein
MIIKLLNVIILIGFVILIGLGIMYTITYIIPDMTNSFGKSIDKWQEKSDASWECMDYCDLHKIKGSHESCARWCK